MYPSLQIYDGSEFVDREPDETRGIAKAYIFDQSVKVKFVPPEGYTWASSNPCWTSRNTMGLLGDNSVEPPIDGSELSTDEMDLHNGIVGATMIVALGEITATLEYLAWNYIFSEGWSSGQFVANDDGSNLIDDSEEGVLGFLEPAGDVDPTWELDEETPFASMIAGTCEVFATWTGEDLSALTADGVYAIDGDGSAVEAEFTIDSDSVHMDIVGRCPRMIYIYSAEGSLLIYVRVPEQEQGGPVVDGENVTARITFALGA